jgi:hypothetical protein
MDPTPKLLQNKLLPENRKNAILSDGVKYTRFLILNPVFRKYRSKRLSRRNGMDSKEDESGGNNQIERRWRMWL